MAFIIWIYGPQKKYPETVLLSRQSSLSNNPVNLPACKPIGITFPHEFSFLNKKGSEENYFQNKFWCRRD